MSGKSLKVVVEINEAYPLLHSAFARIPANVRSERLRALAMIGMYLENGSGAFKGIPVNVRAVVGQLESFQFAVFIGETQPKLLDLLSSISKRARAERLRSLALLALYSESGQIAFGGGKPVTPAAVLSEAVSPGLNDCNQSERQALPANAADPESPLKPAEQTKVVEPQPDRSPMQGAPVSPSTSDASNRVGKGVRSFARSLG